MGSLGEIFGQFYMGLGDIFIRAKKNRFALNFKVI